MRYDLYYQVELTEYVKIQDNIYQVQPKAKCPDDQLFHDRVVPFPVCVKSCVINFEKTKTKNLN